MAETTYDVIVVGAGIEGSATSYQLSRRGVRVLLLEQFPLPHTRGSSHGATRITRKAYRQPYYTHMMHYCTDEWERLQTETGRTLFKKTGYINIGPLDKWPVREDILSMEKNQAPFEALSPESFQQRYPLVTYGKKTGAMVDPEGGILFADRALNTFQRLFVENGGKLKDGEKVKDIKPGEVIQVVTAKQTHKCRSLILCCGPWTNKVLKPLNLKLPLQTLRISVCYWPEKVAGSHSSKHFLPFFDNTNDSITAPHAVYGLPSDEYPGQYKMCLHHGPEVDPESRDKVDSSWVVELMRRYVKNHFPGLGPEPSVVESCFYTNTPDKDLILDRHPVWKNIVIGAGFSGHGFKLSPAVGHILADLALGAPPKYDVNHFRLDRFTLSPPTSKL